MGGMMGGHMALLLFTLALQLSSCQHCAQGKISKATPSAQDEEKYIIPVLYAGPNNQKRDLRNYLALGRVLGRRVVLTGIMKHYTDAGREGLVGYEQQQAALHGGLSDAPMCFEPNVYGYMPVESVLDTDAIERDFQALSVSQLRKQGWDGNLEALVHLPGPPERMDMYVGPLLATSNISNASTVLIPYDTWKMNCADAELQELRDLIKPYKYVGMYRVNLGKNVIPNLVAEQEVVVSELAGCHRMLAEANRALHPAAWLRKMADRYIDEFIDSRDFLCMHVRPYGDKCLDAWRDGSIVPGQMQSPDTCYQFHLDLHDRVGPCAASYMATHNLSRVFVMTHPVIRHQVHDLMARAGVTGVAFVDPLHVEETAGCIDHSATFLSMVEESICAQATHFIGSHISSISQSLGFIRLGMGHMQNLYMEYLPVGVCDGVGNMPSKTKDAPRGRGLHTHRKAGV